MFKRYILKRRYNALLKQYIENNICYTDIRYIESFTTLMSAMSDVYNDDIQSLRLSNIEYTTYYSNIEILLKEGNIRHRDVETNYLKPQPTLKPTVTTLGNFLMTEDGRDVSKISAIIAVNTFLAQLSLTLNRKPEKDREYAYRQLKELFVNCLTFLYGIIGLCIGK